MFEGCPNPMLSHYWPVVVDFVVDAERARLPDGPAGKGLMSRCGLGGIRKAARSRSGLRLSDIDQSRILVTLA